MAARNGSNTSAANTAQTITIAAVSGQRIRLFSLDGSTSAGTSTVAVRDGGAADTVIWQSPGGWLTSSGVSRTWGNVPLEASPGNAMTLTTTAAGGGNTATLNHQADQV